jgi:hypothetical protein
MYRVSGTDSYSKERGDIRDRHQRSDEACALMMDCGTSPSSAISARISATALNHCSCYTATTPVLRTREHTKS